MGKFHVGRHDKELPQQMIAIAPSQPEPQVIERIVYVDRTVEVPVEVIVEKEVIKEVIVEKPVERIIVQHKTVEVPVVYEKEIIKEVPVYIDREVIREVMPKVIDITNHLEMKKQVRTNKRLKAGLVLAMILNLILMVVR